MKRYLLLLLVINILLFTSNSKVFTQSLHPYDQTIQKIVDKVNIDTLWKNLAYLQSIERYSLSTDAIVSSNYLKKYFERLGYDTVYLHSYNSKHIPNVIAIKYGKISQDTSVIIGAHYDVYAKSAPGADDNGSGTVATMEAGRVLANYDFKRTIKLICFSGEEQGILGSTAYASEAKKKGDKIIGVMAMDAISYLYPGDPINSDVYLDSNSVPFRKLYAGYTAMYIPGFTVKNVPMPYGASSDMAAFWKSGYKAIMPSEGLYSMFGTNHMSPHHHSANDLIDKSANNKEQTVKITQSVTATAAAIAEIYNPASVDNNTSSDKIYLNAFPNPASSEINLTYFINENAIINISISDVSGRTICLLKNENKSKGSYNLKIPTTLLNPGLYIIRFTANNLIKTYKISIQ
ncbi:MAG: M28 family peptidase [Bacteroidales bacterium]|nr:M28 family peptidase [Bacteroidales bacterium]